VERSLTSPVIPISNKDIFKEFQILINLRLTVFRTFSYIVYIVCSSSCYVFLYMSSCPVDFWEGGATCLVCIKSVNVAEVVLSCTSSSSNLRQNPEIRAGRVVRWWASRTPTYATNP